MEKLLLITAFSLSIQLCSAQNSIVMESQKAADQMLIFKSKAKCKEWQDFYQKMHDRYLCLANNASGGRTTCDDPQPPIKPCVENGILPGTNSPAQPSNSTSSSAFTGFGNGPMGTTYVGDRDLGRVGKDRFDSHWVNDVDDLLSVTNALTDGVIRKNGAGAAIDAGLSIISAFSQNSKAKKNARLQNEKRQKAEEQAMENQEWVKNSVVHQNLPQITEQVNEAQELVDSPVGISHPETSQFTTMEPSLPRPSTFSEFKQIEVVKAKREGKSTLLIRTDLDINIFLDGVELGTFKKSTAIQKVTIDAGKYLLGVYNINSVKLEEEKWIEAIPEDKLLLEFNFEKQKLEREQKEAEKMERITKSANELSIQLEKLSNNMIKIPGGLFAMGFPGSKKTLPIHKVIISDFEMSAYETTVSDFSYFVKETGYKTSAEKYGKAIQTNMKSLYMTANHFQPLKNVNWEYSSQGEKLPHEQYNHPVVYVSWEDAMAYCEWLSKKSKHKYRLPTEAEWEYVARNGRKEWAYTWGNSKWPTRPLENPSENIMDQTAFLAFERKKIIIPRKGRDIVIEKDDFKTLDTFLYTAPVGSFNPNPLKIYDLGGNVAEWCLDSYDERYYKKGLHENPINKSSSEGKVVRGVSYNMPYQLLESSPTTERNSMEKSIPSSYIGFRIVREK